MPITVAVDAMGGDLAPSEIVAGAVQAADELGVPAGLQLTANDDAVGDPLQHDVEMHRRLDAGDRRPQAVERDVELERPARAGMGEEISDIDAESAHGATWRHGPG